jgi:hypothetical protein
MSGMSGAYALSKPVAILTVFEYRDPIRGTFQDI